MAPHKFYNANIYLGGYAIATDHSAFSIEQGAESLDATAFQSTTRKHIGGLQTLSLSGELYQNYGTGNIEAIMHSLRGTVVQYLVTPDTAAVGDRAFFGSTLITDSKPIGGTVGDMHKSQWKGDAAGVPVVRGQMFKAAGSVTANSASTMVQLGALSAGQKLYAVMHVLSVSGTSPTLDVIVRSDDNSTPTTPTTRITLTQANAIGAQIGSVSGAVTDDYWGITWTLGGTGTPTFSFVVGLGIAS